MNYKYLLYELRKVLFSLLYHLKKSLKIDSVISGGIGNLCCFLENIKYTPYNKKKSYN